MIHESSSLEFLKKVWVSNSVLSDAEDNVDLMIIV